MGLSIVSTVKRLRNSTAMETAYNESEPDNWVEARDEEGNGGIDKGDPRVDAAVWNQLADIRSALLPFLASSNRRLDCALLGVIELVGVAAGFTPTRGTVCCDKIGLVLHRTRKGGFGQGEEHQYYLCNPEC